MTSHTPGPWCFEIGKDNSFKVWTNDYHMFIAKRQEMSDRDEAIANAQLIAAAPELLEALERLVANIEEGDFLSLARIDEAKALIFKVKKELLEQGAL